MLLCDINDRRAIFNRLRHLNNLRLPRSLDHLDFRLLLLLHDLHLWLPRGLDHLDLRLLLHHLDLWLLRGFDHLDFWFLRLLHHLNWLLIGCLNDLNLGWPHILDNFDLLLVTMVYDTNCGRRRLIDHPNGWCMLSGHLDDLHFLMLKPRNFILMLFDFETVLLDNILAIVNLRISVRDMLFEARDAV